jgi:hypothetical protein
MSTKRSSFCDASASSSAELTGIVREDSHRDPVQAREGRDQGAAEEAAQLEDALAIEDVREEPARVVRLATIARHEGEQALLAPLGIVVRRRTRRGLEDRARQVREEAGFQVTRAW